MPSQTDRKIVVIGAGIIGVTTALRLRMDGYSVHLLDRRGIASETSRGNAGAFAFTEIEPLAAPGIIRKAPGWLIDPLGPLSIRPAHALQTVPWLMRFWQASRPDRYRAAVAVQAALMEHGRAALERLVARVDGEPMIRREGQLQLYEGLAAFRASLPGWELRRQHSIPTELLHSPGAIAEIQPGIDPRFTHAGFAPTWMNTVDPEIWTRHLAYRFTARGGIYDTARITALEPVGDRVRIRSETDDIFADHVIIATGAWSHLLARQLGDRIPLETERGYNTTFPDASFDLRTHLTFSGHGFAVSRIQHGLRVGGAVELGGLRLPPNFRRAEVLVEKTRRFLHGFEPGHGTQWMGFRPSPPDGLPIIGPATRCPNVIYAFGHGHLGLTQSAGTAELVSEIIAGAAPSVPLAPISAARFARR